MNFHRAMRDDRGAISLPVVALVVLSVIAVGLGVLAAWALINYNSLNENVDNKVAAAVADAKKAQADDDESKFAAREKEPNRQFTGPDDYGRLTFMYPKTWSGYVVSDTSSGGNYTAYLNPGVVPPVTSKQLFALRVNILDQDYDKIVQSYQALIKSGKLKSTAVSSNGHAGTRLDGTFASGVRGAIVIFKIRDKTATLQTDAETFLPDFEALTKTIDFND